MFLLLFHFPEGNLLSDVAFVLCLDTLGKSDNLNLHVSKPPREESAGGHFYKVLWHICLHEYKYILKYSNSEILARFLHIFPIMTLTPQS